MKNNDLISRSALIAEYDRVHVGAPGGARKLMEDAPAVDAVPVVHGWWERIDDNSWLCSECRKENCYAYNEVSKRYTDYYCPNCGAKMDGENNDERS